jgi:hypothetical protein
MTVHAAAVRHFVCIEGHVARFWRIGDRHQRPYHPCQLHGGRPCQAAAAPTGRRRRCHWAAALSHRPLSAHWGVLLLLQDQYVIAKLEDTEQSFKTLQVGWWAFSRIDGVLAGGSAAATICPQTSRVLALPPVGTYGGPRGVWKQC